MRAGAYRVGVRALQPIVGRLPRQLNRALGLEAEKRFWRQILSTRSGAIPPGLMYRLDPQAELTEPLIVDRLSLLPGEMSILDVGAGPLTDLGKRLPGRTVEIVAVDPLADVYRELLSDAGLVAPVPTLRCAGEELRDRFDEGRFDVVYARNAVDHAVNPLLVIENMLAVAKVGGFVALRHRPREGERRKYTLLHQWNVDLAHSDLVLSNRRTRVNVTERLAGRARVATFSEEGWVSAVLTKLDRPESRGD